MKLLKLEDKFKKGKFLNNSVNDVINRGESKYLKYFLSRNKNYRLHKEVISVIQDKVSLNFNQKLIDTLSSINSPLSNLLLELNNKKVKSIFTNVKAFVTKQDTVVFDTPFGNKKNVVKVGRFVRKLLQMNDIYFVDSVIEEFVTDYYGALQIPTGVYFKILKGEEIRKWYLESNYHRMSGTLGNSCARRSDYQYRFDLYVNNKEIEMLGLFNKSTDKLTARAIIWKKADIRWDGGEFNGVFMDRIYVNDSKHTSLFKKYAEKNGWAYKKYQSYNYKHHTIVDGTERYCNIDAHLTDSTLTRPYMDTMAYVNSNSKIISNGYR